VQVATCALPIYSGVDNRATTGCQWPSGYNELVSLQRTQAGAVVGFKPGLITGSFFEFAALIRKEKK